MGGKQIGLHEDYQGLTETATGIRNIFCIKNGTTPGYMGLGEFPGMDEKEQTKEGLIEKTKEAIEYLKEEIRRVKKVEARMKKAKRIFLVFWILLIVVSQYMYFSSPGRVVVNRNGEIHGLTNKARATLQGKKFWRDQLRQVRWEIQWEESGPQGKAEMENFYEKYPQFRPSTAEIHTDALVGQADQFEWAGFNRVLEEMRRRRIEALRTILPIVQSKSE